MYTLGSTYIGTSRGETSDDHRTYLIGTIKEGRMGGGRTLELSVILTRFDQRSGASPHESKILTNAEHPPDA